jgi:hypothetical protein
MSAISLSLDDNFVNLDEPDYLRASAVLEALLRAADAGHFLKGWNNMIEWSASMFEELLIAHRHGRGKDPGQTWYENQIDLMDNCLHPLATQLEECGVFDEYVGGQFVQNVADIKEHWLVYGAEVTDGFI